MDFLEQHQAIIVRLCASHQVRSLYAFGSVLTNQFTPQSDIDLMVDFKDIDLGKYADNYFSLKFSLEDSLHRKVDLLETQALRNPLLIAHLNQQKRLVYGH